jgi:ABC-type glycerol-3-phosphate transport system permease component
MVVPVLWLVFASTKNAADLYGTSAYALGTSPCSRTSQRWLNQDGGLFFRWLGNSVMYAALGAVLGSLISVMAGYAFDKFQFRWKDSLFGFVLVGVLIPNTATVLPMYLLASLVGMTNTIWAVLIPVLCNPFGVYLARVYSASYVPAETLEAARMDGAGPIRSFFSLGLPMMMPGYITIALFQFVGVWNNFMLPLVMLQDQQLAARQCGYLHLAGLLGTAARIHAHGHHGLAPVHHSPAGGLHHAAALLEIRPHRRERQMTTHITERRTGHGSRRRIPGVSSASDLTPWHPDCGC